jgi:outer membrane receptor protein involved in Fe transport
MAGWKAQRVQATHDRMNSRLACVAWLIVCVLPSGSEAQDAPSAPPVAAGETSPPPAASEGEPALYGARAKVRESSADPAQPTETELAVLQADLGPSFSLAESLPGSLPVFSGVPYLIVRGATPAANATYYDGVQVPTMFHIALGPALINRRMIGSVQLYPGVAPARYGRHTGGALVVDAPHTRSAVPLRELQVTLLDASGYLYAPDVRTTVAWRIGNPGLLMNLLGLDATLNYYDYQIRQEITLGEGTELVLLGLGGGDHLGDRTAPQDDIGLNFHRLAARITRRSGASELGSQLLFSYDASQLGQELHGEAVGVEPSVYFAQRWSGGRMRIGADMQAKQVALQRRPGGATRGSLFTNSDSLSLDPEDFVDGQPYASLPARSMSGVYGELTLEPLAGLTLELGARGDLWLAGSASELAFSPAANVRYRLTPALELHVAFGLSHQARGSPVPLPGLSDVAMDAGLERALQAEVGVRWDLLADLQLEATYFHHRYDDVVYLELILDCAGNTDPQAAQGVLMGRDAASICRGAGLPTAQGVTQGFELYLKRELTKDISGFISYTLSFADAIAADGTPFTPQADVRHMANAVLRWDIGAGFALGLRLHWRTGKMAVNTLFDAPSARFERAEARLPGFFRADVRAAYAWRTGFGALEVSLGVQNVTASSEATNRDCLVDPSGDWSGGRVPIVCTVDYQRAILLPNLGIRAEL